MELTANTANNEQGIFALDEAIEDVRTGRISDSFRTPEELFSHLGL